MMRYKLKNTEWIYFLIAMEVYNIMNDHSVILNPVMSCHV